MSQQNKLIVMEKKLKPGLVNTAAMPIPKCTYYTANYIRHCQNFLSPLS